ncbi:MAG: DEAD/DEAH box helicase [Rhodospirillales bacterium]|nr:DEAD/DEAH box helicase [Rhodospirillales bacterium]
MNSIVQLAPGIDKITKGSLYPHQSDGVAFLLSKKRAILADDMGLGKTRQAIVAMEAGCPEGTILVVCPASIKLNWKREILMVDGEASIEVLGVDRHQTDEPRWVIINYDILGKHADRLYDIDWSGIILDEAHFIKNASKRTSLCLKLLGVQAEASAPLIGPDYVFLLTGTPMTNRPKDLFNLFRCVGHPAARSFLSFAKRYCDAYRNDYGWVTTGASNLDELNLLMKEVSIRRMKDEVLDLPPKGRSWVPVDISNSKAALNAIDTFLSWYSATDPSKPNDTDFLAALTKVRTALHKAKFNAVSERIKDVVAAGEKVVVFTCFTDGIDRHKKKLGGQAVTITGSDSSTKRMAAVDQFQTDPEVRVALCNIIAGGVGITLTAGTHVIFQDLDWVPANHAQAEDRCYRLGQDRRVTVEYFHADGTLDGYIASLLGQKMTMIAAVEAEQIPDQSILTEIQDGLRQLAPALMEEARAARASGEPAARLDALAKSRPRKSSEDAPLLDNGSWEFTSSRDPSASYQVTFGRAGHLECTCPGFTYRGNCKHTREVREKIYEG